MDKKHPVKNLLKDKSILIVDDDVSLCVMVGDILKMEGVNAHVAYDGTTALNMFYEIQPDLVILDLNMPFMNGWEVCRKIRLLSQVPILILTTNRNNQSIVKGLDMGADDYMVKPFSLDVLLARCRALLRRGQKSSLDAIENTKSRQTYDDGYLRVDLIKHRVYVEGELLRLTAKEYEILAYLIKSQNHLRTYEEILGAVWGPEYRDSIDYVHVYLSRLRQKIERDPAEPLYLITEWGIGCRFESFVQERV